MTAPGKVRRWNLGWRKILLGLGVTGAGIAGVCLARGPLAPSGAQVAVNPPAAESSAAPSPASYASCVAVFADGREGITREQLGEYLIARYGEKLEHLINHRIIEDACKAQGIAVTAKDVNEKLTDDLRDLNIDRSRFVKDFLQARGKTLYEWKEDHLRPELMMMRLCHDQLAVSEQDVRDAYEARYGEKIEVRAIEWDEKKKAEAEAAYARIAGSEEEFARAAKAQSNAGLAVSDGKLKPFGRHTLDNADMEAAAFALQPGQVSPLIPIKESKGKVLCYVVLKCDQRLPANTTVPLEKVHDDLTREVRERKAQQQFPKKFEELHQQAQVQLLLERKPSDEAEPYGYQRDAAPGMAAGRVVATLYNGQVQITRQELGEFLIQRYGAAHLPMLVNGRIIEHACQARNITITNDEEEAEFLIDCAKHEMNRQKTAAEPAGTKGALPPPDPKLTPRERFIREMLAPNKMSVFQYKEDIVRPRLMLARLVRDRVKVEQEDFEAAFQAYHGEKVECRMILWPGRDETAKKMVLQEYAKIRDDPKAFDEKARSQASLTLARNEGKLDHPIGHHTTGNDVVEQKVFALQPGEVSSVVETPEGLVVFKCVNRIPPDGTSREQERDRLVKEIFEKKTEMEMPKFFAELRAQAKPRFLLNDADAGDDLLEQAKHEMEASH